ncbi:hypothetical protein PAMC26510_12940 [Caballeronia sordidicola]|uniref:Uncharacterized protein n=1 Tax=Caballeronia sordidicola TaxID=196367 RepID=A0A242MWS2_CABSO|nr:hypothetical protein PAMC26510_12940 [Caballeronia sordidicola]
MVDHDVSLREQAASARKQLDSSMRQSQRALAANEKRCVQICL